MASLPRVVSQEKVPSLPGVGNSTLDASVCSSLSRWGGGGGGGKLRASLFSAIMLRMLTSPMGVADLPVGGRFLWADLDQWPGGVAWASRNQRHRSGVVLGVLISMHSSGPGLSLSRKAFHRYPHRAQRKLTERGEVHGPQLGLQATTRRRVSFETREPPLILTRL